MYFSDFINRPVLVQSYYLAGNNNLMKECLIARIAKMYNRRVSRITNVNDLKKCSSKSIFNSNPIWVLAKRVDVLVEGVVIKLGGEHITAKYRNAGYVEIVCSSMFDNQVEQFIRQCAMEENLNINMEQIRQICHLNNYDLCSCINMVKVLRHYDQLPADSSLLHSHISDTDINKAVDYFIDARYDLLAATLLQSRVELYQLCFFLSTCIIKAMEATKVIHPTWYQKRLQRITSRFDPLQITMLLTVLYKIGSAHTVPDSQKQFYFVRLLAYLGGLHEVSIG